MNTFREEVQRSLDSVEKGLPEQLSAAIATAFAYADALDSGEPISSLGTGFLAALKAIGLTSSAPIKIQADNVEPNNPLDELRARRTARASAAS